MEEEEEGPHSVVVDSRLSLVVPWSIEFCRMSLALRRTLSPEADLGPHLVW
jgi:hypothetical protein